MAILDGLNDRLLNSPKLQYIVKQYGPDFLSTYVGGALLATAATFNEGIAPWFAVTAATGLVSVINKLDHDYNTRELLEAYRDQIAAARNITDPAKVTEKDMRAFAFDPACPNNILRCELDNVDKECRYNLLFHGLSAVAFGAISLGVSALAATAALPVTIPAVGVGMGALFLFQQLDKTITDIGNTLIDADRPTAHRGIMELQQSLHKGQPVSPMQVFGVLLTGDNQLREEIRAKFGADFPDLYLSDKNQAFEQYAKPRGVLEITQQLNSGAMEAEDLILTLCERGPAPKYTVQRPRRLTHYTRASKEVTLPGADLLEEVTTFRDKIAGEEGRGAGLVLH